MTVAIDRHKIADIALCLFFIALVWTLRVHSLEEYPPPIPAVHDELSNILGAKTFLLGRLTNPVAEPTDSFREIHVLAEPSRMMKYQPAIAAFLALGKTLFGDFHWGAVLAVSLAVGAAYWALRGWCGIGVSALWTLLLALLLRAPHYWLYSYWGPMPIFLACFLMLGAYPRIVHQKRYGYLAVGMLGAMLAGFSRPYEGLVLLLTLVAGGGWIVWKQYDAVDRKRFLSFFLPIGGVASALFLAMQGYYNWAVTGDPLVLPYALYDRMFGASPLFSFWSEKSEVLSNHYAVRSMQEWELLFAKNHRNELIPLRYVAGIKELLLGDSLPPDIRPLFFLLFVLIPYIAFIACFRSRAQRMVCAAFLILLGAYCSMVGMAEHFMAGVLATLWLMSAYSAQHARVLLVRIGVWGYAVAYMATIIIYPVEEMDFLKLYILEKQVVEKTLSTMPGKHLIFVDQREEAKTRTLHESWVRNEPDVDSAKIVWAWYMGSQTDLEAIRRFPDRRVWYVNPLSGASLESFPRPSVATGAQGR